jgi:8-oxo-dGTP pyrophosphatase MutT (NUDIX family)
VGFALFLLERERMTVTRDFTASVFVVWQAQIALHRHTKLGLLFFPPGGHIEPNELPNEAAVREVLEEMGVQVALEAEYGLELPVGVSSPRMLPRPRGVQLEHIKDGHEHIDLIYFGRPLEPYDGALLPGFAWYDADALETLDLLPDVRAWCRLALRESNHA